MQARLVETREESVSGVLARLVFVLLESEIDTAVGVLAELGPMASGVKWVPMAQAVLRNPACHNTARSNSPSTRITLRNWRTDSQANNPPFERGNSRWGKASPMQRP